jgi:hypothetical protein
LAFGAHPARNNSDLLSFFSREYGCWGTLGWQRPGRTGTGQIRIKE